MCDKKHEKHEHEEREKDKRAMFDLGAKAKLPNIIKVHVHNHYL